MKAFIPRMDLPQAKQGHRLPHETHGGGFRPNCKHQPPLAHQNLSKLGEDDSLHCLFQLFCHPILIITLGYTHTKLRFHTNITKSPRAKWGQRALKSISHLVCRKNTYIPKFSNFETLQLQRLRKSPMNNLVTLLSFLFENLFFFHSLIFPLSHSKFKLSNPIRNILLQHQVKITLVKEIVLNPTGHIRPFIISCLHQ